MRFEKRLAVSGARAAFWTSVTLLVSACSGHAFEEEGVERLESELVGGQQAGSDDYRSTVRIMSPLVCTAAKVGARHFLTAAHCLENTQGGLHWRYEPGRPIVLTNSIVIDGTQQTIQSAVVETFIHPVWEAAGCANNAQQDGYCVKITGQTIPPDIAVIEIADDSPNIPIATIETAFPWAGDPVVETGYGCEEGLGGSAPNPPRFKLEHTELIHGNNLLHPGSWVNTNIVADVIGSYIPTPGNFVDPDGAASLCPGDSGGPLYQPSATQRRIVGVNAYYTFSPEGEGWGTSVNPAISRTDLHSRVDMGSRYDVPSWLDSIGILDVSAMLRIDSDWGSGYCATLTATNGGEGPTTNWNVQLDLNGSSIYTGVWNGTISGGTITPQPGHRVIQAHATNTSLGFCANRPPGAGTAQIISSSGSY